MSLNFDMLFRLNNEIFTPLARCGHSRYHRFRKHEEIIRDLIDQKNKGRPRVLELLDEVIMGGASAREYIWSSSDTLELALAFLNINRTGATGVDTVLKKAMDGPVDLWCESPASNVGRNAMFELTLGGLVAGAGLHPILGGNTDVATLFKGRSVLFECKRPFSEASVRSNIKEAAKQLKQRQGEPCWVKPCLVVAVCLSRLFTSGRTIPVVDTYDALHERFDSWIAAAAKKYFNSIEEYKRFGLSGVLFYVGCPAVVTRRGELTFKRACYLRSVGSPRDKALLEELSEAIVLNLMNFESDTW